MANTTPFFQAFRPLLFGRRPKSALETARRADSLEDLYALFGDFIPEHLLAPAKDGQPTKGQTFYERGLRDPNKGAK